MIPGYWVQGFEEQVTPAPAAAFGGLRLSETPTQPEPKDEEGKSLEPKEEAPLAYGALASHVMAAWQRNRQAKQKLNYRLLACLRAKLCKYSEEELQSMWRAGQADPVYFGLAAAKQRAASAMLRDIVLPDGDRPWDIQAQANPELPPDVEARIKQTAFAQAKQQMVAAAQQGGQVQSKDQFMEAAATLHEQLLAQVKQKEKKEAERRAEGMRDAIEDLLNKGGWYSAMADWIDNYTTYPFAVLKGPFTQNIKRLKWDRKGNPVVDIEPGLKWKCVSPFDAYPAPQATDCQTGDFIEILHLTETELYSFIGVPGYRESAIRAVLAEHLAGGPTTWLWDEIERRHLEGNDYYQQQPHYMIDAIHYWGSIKGITLLGFGISPDIVDDPLGYYECDVIQIRNHTIRCEVNEDPLGRRPYHNDSYSPIPGSFAGMAIYELMVDCQDGINAGFRAMFANAAISSGPQVVIDMARLAPGETVTSLRPWKEWQMSTLENPGVNSSTPLIQFYQPPSNIEQLLKMIEAFEERADDLTSIPRYSYGGDDAGGAAATSSGLAQLRSDAAKGLERAVAGIDRNIVAPSIEQTFTWEMLYGKNPDIKGDCNIVPRGSAALLVKEHLQQTRIQFLGMTNNPVDNQIIGVQGRRAVLAEVAKVLKMPTDVIPSEQELQKTLDQRVQQPPQPSPDQQLKSKTDLERESIRSQTALAKEGMVHPAAAAALAQASQPQEAPQGTPGQPQPMQQQAAA